jgi:hypothetical protein
MTDRHLGPCREAKRGESGAALLLALTTAALLSAIAASLIVTTAVDMMIAGNLRASVETMYVVEAGVERAIAELARVPDWSAVLSPAPSNAVASFDDRSARPSAPDGRVLSVPLLTAARQKISDAAHGPARFAADRPVWQLYAHAPFRGLLPPGIIAPPGYVLVWVADDGGDGDGNPQADANGQVLLYGDAYGLAGGRRSIEVAIGRAAPGAVRVLSWKEAG